MATVTVNTGFAASSAGNAVPDNSATGLFTSLAVPSDGVNGDTVSGVSLSLIISTTWQGDIVANLRSPSGTVLNLLNRPGSTGNGNFGWSVDNYGNPSNQTLMTFADGSARTYALPATAGVTNIANPVGSWLAFGGTGNAFQTPTGTGVLLPLGTLANFAGFNGENAVGNWSLEVYDGGNGDFANVNQVVLNVTTVPAPGALALVGLGGLVAARRRRA
ncbi:MAG: proprotein convertase P-domain-containing protein [Phycisphaeraceae bacterium]|nr:proprotein convertase P-domain-containing protein [Phycisphaeraceae bacterium]